MAHVRILFDQALTCREKSSELAAYLERFPSDPLARGYAGSVSILLAKHSFNPVNKYHYFLEGRNKLEEAIRQSGKCAELRYLRFSIQTHAPGFLNYRNSIQADKQFLLSALLKNAAEAKEIRAKIITVLYSSPYCSESEKELLRQSEKWKM
jgi:hypothetical protein